MTFDPLKAYKKGFNKEEQKQYDEFWERFESTSGKNKIIPKDANNQTEKTSSSNS